MSKVDYIVGTHWFRFMDEPIGGRYDGENSNMGLVSEYDVGKSLLYFPFFQILLLYFILFLSLY